MRIRFVVFGTVLGTVIGVTVSRVVRWWRTWGTDPLEATKPLPGDGAVADAVASETRGITIDAPPERVWPWLVQMGFGRAGWYSYDVLDQRGHSADAIVEPWQSLQVGDIMPTHPGGGFEVVSIDRGRSLVLRSDTELVTAQANAFAERQAAAASTAGEPPGTMTPGLAASSAVLGVTPQQFAASWAFVLEPIAGGQTRLIERFRVWYGEAGPFVPHVVMPVVGFGVFVMMQKQMVGIKARAEGLTPMPATVEVEPESTPAPTAPPELATAPGT
jgi:hypothetical protein